MDTIIYLPCFDYFLHRQRPHHLLWELSLLGFKVIYCQPSLQDRGSQYERRAALDVTAGLSPNPRPPGPLIPLSDSFILCVDMNALDPSSPHVMWLTHGPYARKIQEWGFRPSLVVSDFADACVEEFQEFAVYEHDKLDCADIVLTVSHSLFRDLKARHPNVHLVPNASDFELFSTACDLSYDLPCPIEIAALLKTGAAKNRKLIGFWGAVTTWVDLDLVVRVAVSRPNWHFLFIGYIGVDLSLLPRLSNITFIGDRDYLSLPFYAKWLDAAIIPFEVREVTRKACPGEKNSRAIAMRITSKFTNIGRSKQENLKVWRN